MPILNTSKALIFNNSEIYNSLKKASPLSFSGQVTEVRGPIIKAILSGVAVGDLVTIQSRKQKTEISAQVISFSNGVVALSPFDSTSEVLIGATVKSHGHPPILTVGTHLLGSLVDSLGNIISTLEPIAIDSYNKDREEVSLHAPTPNILERKRITQQFITGIRSIDTFIPLGYGQRLSLFAPPGVGKSTLISSIAKTSSADINVIALIGERGREAQELVFHTLSKDVRRKTIIVLSTSDQPAIARVNAALTATRIAEYFRDRSLHVLLQIDSLTRLFRAYREVGLAAGEVPVRRGYPPSAFAKLPELIERAGNTTTGSITALYTVLATSDLEEDPMVEEIKGLTDGHIMLSKDLADKGHYPAIDILASLSRLFSDLVNQDTAQNISQIKTLLSRLEHDKELHLLGGKTDDELNAALMLEHEINQFLIQQTTEFSSFSQTNDKLKDLTKRISSTLHDLMHTDV